MVKRTMVVVAALTLAACGSSKSSAGPATVSLGGGIGTAGAGGGGGSLRVSSQGGGDVSVAPSGALPAPKAWSYSEPSLGLNPRTVTTALSLQGSAGTILGDDGTTAATGLRVARGAVLTLTPDSDTDGIPGNDLVTLNFGGAVIVEGTLQTGPANGGSSTASSWSGSIGALAVRPGGQLLLPGVAGSVSVDGGAGGNLDLNVTGNCTNEGTIDARGGRGRNGGTGGGINLVVSNGAVVNIGLATSSGGEGLAGVGGDAGGTQIWGIWSAGGTGDFWNTGSLLARGGNGTAGGGAGAWGYASSCQAGEAFNSGELDTSGGDATVAGPGGSAGSNEIDSSNGRLVVGGRLAARGGRGAGAGFGGSGGWIALVADSGAIPPAGLAITASVGAGVDTSGGDGATGGRAGGLEIWDAQNAKGTSGVTLVGYGSFALLGGAGTTAGGPGGWARIYSSRAPDSTTTFRIGSVDVEAALDLRGGAASAGAGGAGGSANLYSQRGTPASLAYPSSTRKLVVSAPVRVSGGAGSTSGGAGGSIRLFEHVAVEAPAALEASGGAGGSGAGGAGGAVQVLCDGVAHTGAVTADGGASTAAAGGVGGVGGGVTLGSSGGATVRGGVVSVRGGAATTAGADGTVTVDGALKTLTGGQLKP